MEDKYDVVREMLSRMIQRCTEQQALSVKVNSQLIDQYLHTTVAELDE